MKQTVRVEPRIRAAVRKVVRDTFGSKPHRIRHEAGGLSNSVFSVEHGAGDFIVRLNPDPEKRSAFQKEQWATTRARQAGVPVPEILKVGSVPMPFMVLQKSLGTPATLSPDPYRVLQQLGCYAARINSIQTHGFGESFDWASENTRDRPTWHEFLRIEFKLEERLRILKVRRMLAERQLRKIESVLQHACGRGRTPALNHGDLRLKNVIVDRKGEISVILDWENCVSSLAPEWELSLALHDLNIDEKEVFLRGYGFRPKDIHAIAPTMKALNVINYVAEIERLAKGKNNTELEFCRIRLSGALDLFCV